MIMRQKPARPRSGNVAIEAALVFSLCAVLLAGMVEVGQALRRWYQLSTLTDHVGQMIARADAPSAAFIQTVLHNEQTLPVLVQGGLCCSLALLRFSQPPLVRPAGRPLRVTGLMRRGAAPRMTRRPGCLPCQVWQGLLWWCRAAYPRSLAGFWGVVCCQRSTVAPFLH